MRRGFAYATAHTLVPAQPPAGFSYLPASPHRSTTTTAGPTDRPTRPRRDRSRVSVVSSWWARRGRFFAGTGISTRCPSTTPLGLALGPDLPRGDEPGPGTLGHPAAGFLTLLSLLMPAFSLASPPPAGSRRCFPGDTTLPYPPQPLHPGTTRGRCQRWSAAASAVCLSPATLSARNHLTSELLRTLSRVAASKPTSWLSMRSHILSHLAHA